MGNHTRDTKRGVSSLFSRLETSSHSFYEEEGFSKTPDTQSRKVLRGGAGGRSAGSWREAPHCGQARAARYAGSAVKGQNVIRKESEGQLAVEVCHIRNQQGLLRNTEMFTNQSHNHHQTGIKGNRACAGVGMEKWLWGPCVLPPSLPREVALQVLSVTLTSCPGQQTVGSWD